MAAGRVQEGRRERDLVAKWGFGLFIVALGSLLIFGLITVLGFGPIAVADLQVLLQSFANPGPLTDMFHFLLGFLAVVLPWTEATTLRRRGRLERIRIFESRASPARRGALMIIAIVVLAAFLLIAAKEFTFDIWFEGGTVQLGLIDLGLYVGGAGAGLAAMYFAEG